MSFADSRADPYVLGEGDEPSQKLDLGETDPASAGAGAGSSSALKRSHSGPATTKEADDKRQVIFRKMIDTLYRDWETEEAEGLERKATKSASAPVTVKSGPAAFGKTSPSLMGAPSAPTSRAVPISGYAFREGTDPRLEKAFRTVMVANRDFIRDYIAKHFRADDFMLELMNDIGQASKWDPAQAIALEAIYGVLYRAERDVADMEKADLAVYRAMMAQNALNALTARGVRFGGGIYTLRAKRRNVRNKAQRRTRKGLVRQGPRTHRKARRGTRPRKSHRRRAKGL
jgi:hypothetical protein